MRALLSASEHSAEIADATLFSLSEFQLFRIGPGELHLTFARHRFSLPAARADCPAILPRFTDSPGIWSHEMSKCF